MPLPGENPRLDAETALPMLYAISIAFVVVSTIIVALRLYTRFLVIRSPGADDATIAVAQVFSIGVTIATILRTLPVSPKIARCCRDANVNSRGRRGKPWTGSTCLDGPRR